LSPTLCYSINYNFLLGHYDVVLQQTRSSALSGLVTISSNGTKTSAWFTKTAEMLTTQNNILKLCPPVEHASKKESHFYKETHSPKPIKSSLFLCCPLK
jgi:hypothetical protein